MAAEAFIREEDLPADQVAMRDFVLDDVLGFEKLTLDVLRIAQENPGYLHYGVNEARELLIDFENDAVHKRLEQIGRIAHRFTQMDHIKNGVASFATSAVMPITSHQSKGRSGSGRNVNMGDSGFAY